MLIILNIKEEIKNDCISILNMIIKNKLEGVISMFEEEFIIKHINYVFNNWKVTYEDLDQDVEADYKRDALTKSVEDLI